jgi:hypothetical protein
MTEEVSATIAADRMYDPSEVVLIGSHLEPMREDKAEDRQTGNIKVQSDVFNMLTLTCQPLEEETANGDKRYTSPTIAVIYAYAYEGHTYKLPKPRVMVVNSIGESYKSSGNEAAAPEITGKLYMWRMSKHHHTISIELESGSVEKLVLEGNTPGNRSVTSYSSHMQLSHRGGKLS